ncbi:MAG: threonylcarbamoyl-AMP synthase [Proteobacteria bacterium]|nr:threonylcarbamoyl-AMP synthase [Pseudomonadota bacterium]
MIQINPENPQKKLINKVVEILKEGGVIAYPTDTIYGIGCDIFNKRAIEKIYRIKGRDKKKPMSFVCSDLSHISQFAKVSNYAYRIMKRLLPGPYTFVLEASSAVPKLVSTRRKTVGIRIPNSEIALSIVRDLGNPIISTSANVSGENIISDPFQIEDLFGRQLDAVIDGGNLSGDPSTVIDLSGVAPVVLRVGAGDTSWVED